VRRAKCGAREALLSKVSYGVFGGTTKRTTTSSPLSHIAKTNKSRH